MSKKQKIYTAEFKAEAIKAIGLNNGNVSETARQLGISMQTLSNWYNKAKAGCIFLYKHTTYSCPNHTNHSCSCYTRASTN